MTILAQTIPGADPTAMMVCIVMGLLAGLAGLVLCLARVDCFFTLAALFFAVASVVSNWFIVLRGRDFDLGETLRSVQWHWRTDLVIASPLFLALGTVVVLFLQRWTRP